MKKFYLVDASSLFFRAFYAVRPLHAPSGLPTNAIYGYLSMILKLLKEDRPDYLIFCYDRKEPSFRKDLYVEYKAHRTEMPEELSPQIPYIKKLAELLGLPGIEAEGFEADDIIGTLALNFYQRGHEVFIVSGDKDFAQLLRDRIYLYDTMKGLKLGPAEALEKWGVRPDQFIDYLALVGDTSDNIPGVAGIGPKGAQKLLQQFSSVEDLYQRIDELPSGSVKDKLIASKDNAFLSKKLVTIHTSVPVSQEEESYQRRPFHKEELRDLMLEFNFKTLEKNLWDLDLSSASKSTVLHSLETESPVSKKKKRVRP